mmetsp:Transcript_16569/g.22371  ORF Transcript_16569/g.22371 Transcript_16569/m.22371 type:complete len:88 (-) Transcript_16569:372-635(-)|eukprot:CAMPEP_0185599978 /NCGR_PEP_ID=MMETSP0434-20130131/83081_1 /TAXON_ID=626734 ORGANISM="Favella taraikaensis, Strain Fe Narragansett Bay" /NCGR_SAMPLE_ID=MMETSP0434 /ASSEMBLY_ACC=CAM_ASM_000379 /LENGTH=87 /DNA_ID=CAMNT_0028229591 /DNA_START=963 /DNA_END=1226 /DNA_ORIENTATION=-
MRFVRRKLSKELDVTRIVPQQRETFIAYLAQMHPHQQSVCQKLAQITYNESLSSGSSSADEDAHTSLAWTGADKRNLELLFWDKERG